MQNKPEHSPLGASASYRWIACPGSIALSDGAPERDSYLAREGNAAHALAENALRKKKGQRIEYVRSMLGVPVPGHEEFIATEDMLESVELYVRHCESLLHTGSRDEIFYGVEEKVSLAPYGRGIPGGKITEYLYGTADFWALKDGILFVVDFKHGQWLHVGVEGNPQLKFYAAGVLSMLRREYPFTAEEIKGVVATIVQPRDDALSPIRSTAYGLDALDEWVEETLIKAAIKTQLPDAKRLPGDHCRYCPGQARCPERLEKIKEKLDVAFIHKDGKLVADQPVEQLTMSSLKAVLDSKADIVAYLKECEEYAKAGLEQGTFSVEDRGSMGYKLVQGKGQRKFQYDDESVADTLCDEFGLGDDEMFERKMRSPAQLEKEIGPTKCRESEVWNRLVKTVSKSKQLVPLDDPRPAVEKVKANEKFKQQ